jgi:hypothetical protein
LNICKEGATAKNEPVSPGFNNSTFKGANVRAKARKRRDWQGEKGKRGKRDRRG